MMVVMLSSFSCYHRLSGVSLLKLRVKFFKLERRVNEECCSQIHFSSLVTLSRDLLFGCLLISNVLDPFAAMGANS